MAVFMGLTMVVSVLGFAFLQGSSQPNTQAEEELPAGSIINYTLSPTQRQSLAVDQGKTLIDFVYDPENCTECGLMKASLESIATQFGDQVVLSEIKVSGKDYVDLPRILMASQIGTWSKKGVVGASEIERGFCSVVLYPPLGCAIKPQAGQNNTPHANKSNS